MTRFCTAELEPVRFGVPRYSTVMGCEPRARLVRLSTARPLVRSSRPSSVVSSRKTTVPMASEGDKLAVRSTCWPYSAVVLESVRPTTLAAWVMARAWAVETAAA